MLLLVVFLSGLSFGVGGGAESSLRGRAMLATVSGLRKY